jgi:hypothetical protein
MVVNYNNLNVLEIQYVSGEIGRQKELKEQGKIRLVMPTPD